MRGRQQISEKRIANNPKTELVIFFELSRYNSAFFPASAGEKCNGESDTTYVDESGTLTGEPSAVIMQLLALGMN